MRSRKDEAITCQNQTILPYAPVPVCTIIIDNMDDDVADSNTLIDESFRPFKRRKFIRKRVGSSSDAEEDANTKGRDDTERPVPPSVDGKEQTDVETHLSVVELLRRRRAAQKRRAGIEFSNATPVGESSSSSLILPKAGDDILDNDESLDKILTVVDRFAPQTGQVADVDKHMYAKPHWVLQFEMHLLTA